MTDKTRQLHRLNRTPRGFLPNWVVAVVAACLGTVAMLFSVVT